jgi:O-antigen/teichoic acid export membrane protein
MGSIVVASPAISVIWIGKQNYYYVIAVILLSAGYFINIAAVPDYLAGRAIGVLRHNIWSNVISVSMLVGLGYPTGRMFGYTGVLIVVSIAVAAGAVFQHVMNSALLRKHYEMEHMGGEDADAHGLSAEIVGARKEI